MVFPAVAEATGMLSVGLVEVALEGSIHFLRQLSGSVDAAVDLWAGPAHWEVMALLLSWLVLAVGQAVHPTIPLTPDMASPFRTAKLLRYFHSGSGASRLATRGGCA